MLLHRRSPLFLLALVVAAAALPLRARADWIPMPGPMQQISVGSATQIAAVNQNNIYRFTGSTWTQITGSLVNVSVAADGTAWGVNLNAAIYKMPAGGTWQAVAAPAGVTPKQVSTGSATNVWLVSTTGGIFQWSGTSWMSISGSLANVSAGADGTVIGVNSGGGVYKYQGNNSWTAWPGSPGAPFRQISYGNASTLWAVATDNTVYRWSGTAWALVSGPLAWVSCGADGTIAGTRPDAVVLSWRAEKTCSVTADCNDHALATNLSVDKLSCVCACRNQWSGLTCNVCAPQYSGADCDRCAEGRTNYPACTVLTIDLEAEKTRCDAKCESTGCADYSVTVSGTTPVCTCSTCTTAPRTCGISAGTEVPCTTPTNKCLTISGQQQCVITVGGVNKYAPCAVCH